MAVWPGDSALGPGLAALNEARPGPVASLGRLGCTEAPGKGGLGLRSPVFCQLSCRVVGTLPWEVESQPRTTLLKTV